MTVVARIRPRRLTRSVFRSRLIAALGGDVRLLWMPRSSDTTTATTEETPTGQVITWDATVASRLSKLGLGYAQSFTAGSSQYGTAPDTSNLSFGNGTTDSSFSIVAVLNVTDTAVARFIIGKDAAPGAAGEWSFGLTSGDVLRLVVADQSVPALAFLTSNAAVTQGTAVLLGGTYDVTAGSGSTAANGMALYQNGAAIAATATNNSSGVYVAMENLTDVIEIGTVATHAASTFFEGSMALIAICAKALSAADHAAINVLCRRYFGYP